MIKEGQVAYNNFFKEIPLYYINLENRKDRNDYMMEHLEKQGCKEYYRINAFSPDMLSENVLQDGKDLGTTIYETAATFSHILAVKTYLENSSSDYVIITEDDVDFDNVENFLLNRKITPAYTAQFFVPVEQDDGSFLITKESVKWPVGGVWNLDISTISFDNYLAQINEFAYNLDQYNTNLISRFMTTIIN